MKDGTTVQGVFPRQEQDATRQAPHNTNPAGDQRTGIEKRNKWMTDEEAAWTADVLRIYRTQVDPSATFTNTEDFELAERFLEDNNLLHM
jgi:hypothetical protein